MIAFWVIVLVGVVWIAYSVGSDRRNPPMRKCFACKGEGYTWPQGKDNAPLFCEGCQSYGWVEA